MSCGSGSEATDPGAEIIQLYCNGFLFPWNGNAIALQLGMGSTP